MAIQFATPSITIPLGTGRRSIQSTVSFSGRVVRAGVALNGFKIDYDDDDHHINIVEVDTDLVRISGGTVVFNVECQYADKNFDDKYSGYVTALIIAETA
ncbi:hypothetical protein [Rhodococcus artemisiae]|uniref:Uncharacterized protein n=1 Tax=Rhodococcus artemisiae TaxID=714159 RepID=A0ABU7L4W9_9NOCA|nr:hypothetical protein [Rhodococcus artemisiae]MEE2056588.1 hypothetical protein [Rhodococcus artemisiae]